MGASIKPSSSCRLINEVREPRQMCRNNWVSKVASSGRQWMHCLSPMCQVDEAMGCDMVRWTTSCLVDNLVTVGAIVVTSVRLTYVSRSDLY